MKNLDKTQKLQYKTDFDDQEPVEMKQTLSQEEY